MVKSWSTIELAYFWTKPDWIQIERQSNRGFLKWRYPQNHPGHGWPWLSIETHGDDWGSKPFREPPMKWSVFTDHASALAILLNCRLGDWSYVAHIDLGCSSKLMTHWLDQVMYLSYWRWKSWCFEYSKYLQRQWISRSQLSNSGPLLVRRLDQQMQRVPSAQQNKRSSRGMNLSLRSWQQKKTSLIDKLRCPNKTTTSCAGCNALEGRKAAHICRQLVCPRSFLGFLGSSPLSLRIHNSWSHALFFLNKVSGSNTIHFNPFHHISKFTFMQRDESVIQTWCIPFHPIDKSIEWNCFAIWECDGWRINT